MMNGIGKSGMMEVRPTQVQNQEMVVSGVAEGEKQIDAKGSATEAKFGDVYKKMQAQYGDKTAQKPREIKKSLGKDDFLKIMVTQMKNQDPTNPFKADQMATQLAQFTSVEQLQNVNQNLGKMSSQNKPMENMAMTNLIGKRVTIDRERFPHVEGQGDNLNFTLPHDAATVHVSIVNDAGESVFDNDLGANNAGEVNFTWDGLRSNSIPAKGGTYLMKVAAKDDRGKAVDTNPRTTAQVIGVSFEGNEPIFLVGDAKHQDKVTMKNIVRIELDQLPESPQKEQKTQVVSSREQIVSNQGGREK